jgi:urease accessory protein UreH
MRVPLADVGRCGRLSLTFGLQGNRTVLKDSYCEVPFKITRLLDASATMPQMILMQCTAGLFGGDDVECSIRVERGASVRITQQSATKVHPSQDRSAVQRNRIYVEEGAALEMVLEPIIPFADSRLEQSTRIDLEEGGQLAYWEGFMTGRVGRGESWQFQELASETSLYVAGELTYLDRFQLCRDGHGGSRWSMFSGTYLGTGLVVNQSTASLHEVLPAAGVDAITEHCTAVRVVSADGPEFHGAREAFYRAVTLTKERPSPGAARHPLPGGEGQP